MWSRRAFLSAPLAITGCARKPGTGFPGYAFVANSAGHAVAAVDLNAFAVARHVRLDAAPTQVAAPPRRAAVYALTPETGTIHEIRTDSLAVARTGRVGTRASAMQLTADSNALWLLCPEAKKLIRLGLGKLEVEAGIVLPATPASFHLAADGVTAAVSFGAAGLALVDLEKKRCGSIVSGNGTIGQVRFQFNSRTLIAANLDKRLLSLYDVPSGQLIVHLPLAVRPDRLCFNWDGGQLFVTGEGSDGVVVVYPYRAEVSGTVLAGRAPGEMAASGAPQYLFVASPKSGDVSILNIDTLRVIAAVSVGTEPCYITITPDDQFALVLNKTSGDMAVLRVGAITAKRNKSAALFTMIPVGSEPVSAVVRAV